MAGSLFPIEGVLIANMQNNLYATDPDKVRGTHTPMERGYGGSGGQKEGGGGGEVRIVYSQRDKRER